MCVCVCADVGVRACSRARPGGQSGTIRLGSIQSWLGVIKHSTVSATTLRVEVRLKDVSAPSTQARLAQWHACRHTKAAGFRAAAVVAAAVAGAGTAPVGAATAAAAVAAAFAVATLPRKSLLPRKKLLSCRWRAWRPWLPCWPSAQPSSAWRTCQRSSAASSAWAPRRRPPPPPSSRCCSSACCC